MMGARILIIEDNPANMELVRYLIESAGHTAVVAADGSEGLEVARGTRPDLVITDLRMPVMDGFEFLRRFRMDPLFGDTAVVAVTASSMAGDRDKTLAAGFTGYIPKPIEPETFVQAVDDFLPRALRSGGSGRGR